MHYQNGRAAQVGDLVRGKGYNFKHEIIGILIEARPEQESCNCTVACIGTSPSRHLEMKMNGWFNRQTGAFETAGLPEVRTVHEYGQLDAFVALDPTNGEILPPE